MHCSWHRWLLTTNIAFLKTLKPKHGHLIRILLCRLRHLNRDSPESICCSFPLRVLLADHIAQIIILIYKKTDQVHLASIIHWQDVSREHNNLKLAETLEHCCCYGDENIHSPPSFILDTPMISFCGCRHHVCWMRKQNIKNSVQNNTNTHYELNHQP